MSSFFFPCLGIVPHDLPIRVAANGATLHCRQWETSTFDFATLGASHGIQFSWHLLEVFAANVTLEFEIVDAADYAEAQDRARILQSMLYLEGISPIIMPFAMTHSMRDYSGINFRDSDALRQQLPEELQQGFVSADGKIEGWLHEPALQSMTIFNKRAVGEPAFQRAADNVKHWQHLEANHAELSTARKALQTAPMIPDLGSSLLHAWQGIETLFTGVSTEVTFRLSLLVSQLCEPVRTNRRKTYQESKKSYGTRSRVAHGNVRKLTHQDWVDAWDLLGLCLAACLERGMLPTEDELTAELLA